MVLIKKGHIYELSVENVAYGAKGIAKIENFTVFIDNAIPGDIVKATITKKYRNYAEAKIIDFLQYSDHRIRPLCSYSGICGGCKWQFLSYNQQLIYKSQHVSEALQHIALIKNFQVKPTIPSDNILEYRNKMEFSCSDRRWLLQNEMNSNVASWFGLGLHVPGTFYKVLDISACLLQPKLGNSILCDVRSFMKKSTQPPYGLKTHTGFWRFLVLRHSVAYEQWMVNVVTTDYDIETIRLLADRLTSKYENIVSIMNAVTAKKSGVATGKYNFNLAGQSTIRDQIGRYDFDISIDSFFQTNSKTAKKLYDVVKFYADLSGDESVLDLYSGTGTIAIYLSDMAKEVTGIEIAESAVCDAKRNCTINGITNCKFVLGDVKNKLSNIHTIPDVVIIDPPRAGLHKAVLNKVIDMSPNKLIYISCNPATFARDILHLKQLYKVESVQPVDMFPHTFHVEVVAKLSKKEK